MMIFGIIMESSIHILNVMYMIAEVGIMIVLRFVCLVQQLDVSDLMIKM